MENYKQEQDVQFKSSVQSNPSLALGAMQRKTLYRVENFPPVSMEIVYLALGRTLADEMLEDIQALSVYRNGERVIPVGSLVDLLGERATREIRAMLFSKPVWIEEVPNLVVMAGLTDSLDKHFKASSYTSAWYVGLTSGTPTFAEGNTMGSHVGWSEVVPYSGARPTLTLGTVVSGSVDNSAAKASYTINATMVVGGAFLVTLPTAGQTSGTLYGGAAFNEGNRSVLSGDTLNVTVTLTAVAA